MTDGAGELDSPSAENPEVIADVHVCPECGREFAKAINLGSHRRTAHGVVGSSKSQTKQRRRRDGAPRRAASESGSSRREKRERAVRETLIELAEFSDQMQGRSEMAATSLSEVIRRDAPKIAVSLSWVGEKLTPIGFLIDRTMGHGGVITIARGFNGVIMHAVRQWRELLHRRAEQAELDLLNEQLNPLTDAAPDADAADQG